MLIEIEMKEEPKFKVGDEVTCIQPTTKRSGRTKLYHGVIFRVRLDDLAADWVYLVKFPGAKIPRYEYPENLITARIDVKKACEDFNPFTHTPK